MSVSGRALARRLTVLALVVTALCSSLATAAPAGAATLTLGQRAVAEAQRHYQQPYHYGSAGPTRFDCSGFTMYVFSRLGRSLPHSSASQYNARGVKHISRSQLRVGDLVFTIRSGAIRHVGIYAGSNAMWAATQTGDVVRKQSLSGRTLVFGRVS
jgi:cell wall-associated NlpC family hydrolase